VTTRPSPSPGPSGPDGTPSDNAPPPATPPPPPAAAATPPLAQEPDPDPDQAWKALGLVNDWIRHADSKTGAMLAAAGVSGGVFYNLVKDQHHPGRWLTYVAIACAAAIFLTAAFALLALMPRLSVKAWWKRILGQADPAPTPNGSDNAPEDPMSLLFFRDIARSYKSADEPNYADVLATLTGDNARLTRQIGRQVHQNAHVAHRKFRWSTWAIRALGCDLVLLAWTAFLVGKR
jgi:hypothetical protein